MKPNTAIVGLCVAGVVTLSLDGIAKTFDPQAEDHDTFQLVTTATSGTTVVKRDTVSGALIGIPANPAVMMRLLLKHG